MALVFASHWNKFSIVQPVLSRCPNLLLDFIISFLAPGSTGVKVGSLNSRPSHFKFAMHHFEILPLTHSRGAVTFWDLSVVLPIAIQPRSIVGIFPAQLAAAFNPFAHFPQRY